MATFYRVYAFDKKDLRNKLDELELQNKKVVQILVPQTTFPSYEIVYTDDFEKQAIVNAEAKRKKYYEDLFDRAFGKELINMSLLDQNNVDLAQLESSPKKAKEILEKLLSLPIKPLEVQPITYTLSVEQVKQMNAFMEKHNKSKKCPVNKQRKANRKKGIYPCGGYCQYSINITLSSVADIATIKCSCGEEEYLGEV